ncbi:MAG: DUF559 domain-containing protein [Chloroflexota bacterium]|nr:DUF559 domain-containing protein [Chloroflexota bacterium]
MAARGELLVAIINNRLDFNLARDQHWYRIPAGSAQKWLGNRPPPQWLALYQTKVFDHEQYSIRYYAQVLDIQQVPRGLLFPDDPQDARARQLYYKLLLGPLQTLPQPIFSRRARRIVFIPTTWQKFQAAAEINDLYDESPLEDRLWAELKRLLIPAERQEFLAVGQHNYALDFAIYCQLGKLNIETDGDTWHADPARIPLDNLRDNDLETAGWKLLRFDTLQIREQLTSYCLHTIIENINKLDGPADPDRTMPRRITLDPTRPTQLSLFDDWGPPDNEKS